MASVTALWLSFDVAFSEVEQLCIEARAAQLALQRKVVEAEFLHSLASARPVALSASTRSSLAPLLRENDARDARASELARDLAFYEAHPDGPNLVELRTRIRKRLQWLKGELAESLSEHEVHYVLLPLVIYIDELVTSVTRGEASRWEPLQSELYDVANGGELFYTLLDEHLRKSETHPIVFQVFYFCLSDGFIGMAERDHRRVEHAKTLLAARIPLAPTGETGLPQRQKDQVELVAFPWQYYAGSVVAIAAGWAVFSLAARWLPSGGP